MASRILVFIALLGCVARADAQGIDGRAAGSRSETVGPIRFEYTPAPPDNPLKGFVPYARAASEFPHSLEFKYLSLCELMSGPNEFNWAPLDRLLEDVASRGCQTVFRVYLEFPGKPTGVPQFLLDGGLKLHEYLDGSSRVNFTPDYGDSKLRAAMVAFIKALGQRYDADRHVGYITAGLLGYWGEWHTSGRRDLWASEAVQREVMDAYEVAFKETPVLLRYPVGGSKVAANSARPFGYHDDSFAWATMPTGNHGDRRFFLTRLEAAGPEAVNKWRQYPIGGETRPEIWAGLWDEKSSAPAGQEFIKCVEATHATWLMDSSINRTLDAKQRERAIAGARRLGYELHLVSAELELDRNSGELVVALLVKNTGVAPFYRDWPVELGAIDAGGQLVKTWKPGWKVNGLLPGDAVRKWEYRASLPAGNLRLAVRIPNPMPSGRPLRFANREQDAHLPGWLTVGKLPL